MAKIFEYMGIVVLFYSNEHNPIHVHGKFQGFESKADFVIVDGKVIDIVISHVKGKRPLPRKEKKEFGILVEKFKNEIVQKWVDYFVYNKTITCVTIEGRVK